MGLTIGVGIFPMIKESYPDDPEPLESYRNIFSKINVILDEAGLPEHHENEDLIGDIGSLVVPWVQGMGPYSRIHYLRRFYAHVLSQRASKDFSGVVVPPEPFLGHRYDVTNDPFLRDAYEWQFDEEAPCSGSHLIQHGDSQGYYIPIDFPSVLNNAYFRQQDAAWEHIGSLGSSYGLQRECQDVAAILELDLSEIDVRTDSDLTLEAREKELRKRPRDEQPFWLRQDHYLIEAYVCWELYLGSLASLASGLALRFG
jgi:hypothetical protein